MLYNCFLLNGADRLKLHESDPNSRVKCLGTLKQPVNSVDNFTFTMYADNPCYKSVSSMLSLVEILRSDNGKLVFRGRVLKPTSTMDSSGLASRKYICEGELSYLCDSIQPYQTISGNYVTQRFISQALSVHNSAMPEDKQIFVGRISVSGTTPSSYTWHYVSTWQALKDYISKYGGEVRLRYGEDGKRYLDYTDTVWVTGSDTPIELAVNMQSVSYTVDPTSIASGIYAVGAKLSNDGTSAKRLELGEVIWNTDLRQKYGDIVVCVTWDDVTLESNLRRKAAEWLQNQSGELHQYSVSAVDLSGLDHDFDEFEVGVQYPIKNPLIGLDDTVRCISKTIDINDPTKTKLTFGDKYETLTALASARNSTLSAKIENFATDISEQQQAYAQQLVASQTALITGAEGGYVYQHLNAQGKPQELFFLNSPDIDTATQALRINQNGIGFWDASAQTPPGSAMTGPYKDAWTIDGTFHTEFICGKKITGFTFDNGNGTFKVEANGAVTAKNLTITNGSIDCGNGKFTVDSAGNVVANSLSSNNATITGGSIDFVTSSETDDRIRLSYNEWDMLLMPLELCLTNSDENFEFIAQAGGIFFSSPGGSSTLQGNGLAFKYGGKTRAVLSPAGLTLYGADGTTVVANYDTSGNMNIIGNVVIGEGSTITFDDAWIRYPGGTVASLKNLLST